jgi:two-component system sensor histidine kinase PrrB
MRPTRARIRRARRIVLLAVGGGIAGVGGLAWWLAGLALASVTELRAGAARVSGTRDLRERLPVVGNGPEEVRALAGSLNEMLARLESSSDRTEAALRAARTFTADAGHELRTPLTALRANVDTLARNPDLPDDERARLLVDIEADQRRMAALLDGLQALARGDAGVPGTRAPVDLGDLAAHAVAAARRRHPEVRFELEASAGTVDGVPDGLRMLLDNLIENAARHGRRDGTVRVAVDGTTIVVDDDGPGLAIVAQQAALHGGRARAEEGPLGGARIVVELGGSAAAR